MKTIFLSLGSNINAEHNIGAALAALKSAYGEIKVSPIYESESVGFDGDYFLNLMMSISYSGSVGDLARELKVLEDQLGRVRNGPKFGPRVIDIDIVLFGDLCGAHDGVELPRGELTENAYVLLPLKELSPNTVDPRSGENILELWRQRSEKLDQQKLWRSGYQYR